MQAFQVLIDGFKAILKNDPAVMDVTANGAGINVLVVNEDAGKLIRAKHERYRGMPVYTTVPKGIERYKFLAANVYVTPGMAEVRARSGTFTLVASRGERGLWASLLYVVHDDTGPSGCLQVPLRKSLAGAIQASERVARQYARLVRASIGK